MKQRKEPSAAFDQQVKFLKKIPFFQNFDDHELKQLLAVSRWLKVPPGTLVIKEDNVERVFYILVKGNVSVFTSSKEGKNIELTTLSTGDTFGEMALVSETRRTAGVRTTTESFILMVEPDILNQASVFLQLKFYRRFCEILVTRLIAANKRMSTLSAPTPTAQKTKKTTAQKPSSAKAKPAGKPSAKISTTPPPEETSRETAPPPQEVQKLDLSQLPPVPALQAVAKSKMQRRIQGNQDLAMNPAVTARLAPFLVGECEETRKFAELISCDPIIAAKVIQHANSSFYRRTTTVTSIPHAMITMGIKHLQELVAGETIKVVDEDTIFGGFSQLSDSFWLHSVVVARIAELLKDTIRVTIPDDVYLAGLFHDIGILALDQQQQLFYPQLLRPDFIESDLCDSERKYVGIDHGQAGAWLGEKMGLPKPYRDVMIFHHCPEKARENALLVALIHLANHFAKSREVIIGDKKQPPPPPLNASFGWVIVQEHHRAFIDVNLDHFILSFNTELDRRWGEISTLIPM
ncbi:MAG: HDOD domain-containing protein [Desulfobulbaceae bacterium]|nr:HDOD domain-containing protein [Desulfobulbaceae bacterium]